MPDNPSDWISHPPAPNEARIAIAIGRNAKLNPELRDSLEQFARSLSQGTDPHQRGIHSDLACQRVYIGECAVFVECHTVSGM